MFIRKPWAKRISIYEDIKNNFDEKKYQLPDEEIRRSKVGFDWVPGALDGAFGHHVGSNETDKQMAQILKDIALHGKTKDKVSFYKYIEEDHISSYIDSFIEKIIEIKTPNSIHLKDWIKFLVLESPDRGAVKMGIALSGITKYTELIDSIRILGRHEEFTLYASVALMNLTENSEMELWELAKQVHGWGRIHLVERLENTENPDIKEWILREGYRNSIMYEYLALIAAETGELLSTLNRNDVDNDLLISASEIIEALVMEGPVDGISVYKHSYELIFRYLKLIMKKQKSIEFVITCDRINDYVDSIELSDFEIKQGWTEKSINEVKSILNHIFSDDSWKDFILSLVNTDDEVKFWKVNQAAKVFNLDMKDIHWKKVKEKPNDSGRWYRLIESYGKTIDNELLNYAKSILPLDEMCTGAKNEMGLGNEYSNYSILMYILQSLRDKNGLGKEFVLYGLRSPIINNRNMSINVIESWSKNLIDIELIKYIDVAIKGETNNDVKNRLENLKLEFVKP